MHNAVGERAAAVISAPIKYTFCASRVETSGVSTWSTLLWALTGIVLLGYIFQALALEKPRHSLVKFISDAGCEQLSLWPPLVLFAPCCWASCRSILHIHLPGLGSQHHGAWGQYAVFLCGSLTGHLRLKSSPSHKHTKTSSKCRFCGEMCMGPSFRASFELMTRFDLEFSSKFSVEWCPTFSLKMWCEQWRKTN